MAADVKQQSEGFLVMIRNPDIQFAVGLLGIVMVMVIPLPPLMLDLLLCISISSSIMILLVSIYVKEPLEFSTFPTVLLITTLFRLSLNVGTTRSILLNGADGSVSEVVRAFGEFVVGGNYFIGFVIFAILVIINFIVITKGAGRVAEVAARFTLDAMPGKQMSIDADLNAGVIDREEAKARRSKIEQEADFYGSMDGASKFVRGDAIAGIIIAVVNIVVGLIVGVMTHGMSLADSVQRFTLLTVGDGLVSQIPALLISTAAGIVVTRANGNAGLSKSLSDQLFRYTKAIYLSAAMSLFMALLPGLPSIPFLALAVMLFFGGRYATRTQAIVQKEKEASVLRESEANANQDSLDTLLHLDILSLEVGVGLIPLVDGKQNGEILDRIVSTRKQFAQDLGLIVPMVMVRDNIQLQPGEYQILLKGSPVATGNLMIDYYLAMDPGGIVDPIDGIETKEPAYGLDALWIKPSQKDDASFRGYTVVNGATVVVTHLSKVIEDNAHLLLGRQEAQEMVEKLKQISPKVVEEVISTDRLTIGDIVRVLQNLLSEKVSIRDSLTIFETIADHCRLIKNPDALTRYVRKALGRTIIQKHLGPDMLLPVLTLDRALEDVMVSGLQHHDDGSSSLQIDPKIAHDFLGKLASGIEIFQRDGSQPILLCGSLIRWDLKQLINRFIPGLTILAFDELPAGTHTRILGSITL